MNSHISHWQMMMPMKKTQTKNVFSPERVHCTRPGKLLSAMKIVLYQPQIPQNTGNIVRTCSVTGAELMLVEPLGFSINDRWLKRAGLDYWSEVQIDVVADLEKLLEQTTDDFYFFSSKATTCYADVHYSSKAWLIFGCETTGLPAHFFERWPQHFVTIPMQGDARCLNLANSASIGLYEAWRQQGFRAMGRNNSQ
jgi:tRNA (cytidine/uridine-2'-O-)-methyltransferase